MASMKYRSFITSGKKALIVGTMCFVLSACASEKIIRGQSITPEMMEQVKVGSIEEQVLVAFGTPSTVSTVAGKTFYYVSQTVVQSAQFMKPSIQDQKVVAVYFDKNRRVQRIAEYGLKDGQVFDFVSRTTPSGGEEQSFLRQIFKAANFGGGFGG